MELDIALHPTDRIGALSWLAFAAAGGFDQATVTVFQVFAANWAAMVYKPPPPPPGLPAALPAVPSTAVYARNSAYSSAIAGTAVPFSGPHQSLMGNPGWPPNAWGALWTYAFGTYPGGTASPYEVYCDSAGVYWYTGYLATIWPLGAWGSYPGYGPQPSAPAWWQVPPPSYANEALVLFVGCFGEIVAAWPEVIHAYVRRGVVLANAARSELGARSPRFFTLWPS